MTEALEIHIIELPKIKGKEEEEDALLDWLYFLDNPASERTKKGMEKNKKIQDAKKELKELSQDERMRDIAFHQKLAEMDQQVRLRSATEEGQEIGRKKVAKKMIQKKMNIPEIMELTGLTEEEIKQMQEEMKKEEKK